METSRPGQNWRHCSSPRRQYEFPNDGPMKLSPVWAYLAGSAATVQTGFEVLWVQSSPFSQGKRNSYWMAVALEQKHTWSQVSRSNWLLLSGANLKLLLQSEGSFTPLSSLFVPIFLPWIVEGGQTISVCWKGSVWLHRPAGRVGIGTLCWASPGMLMVACWYNAGW